MKIFVSDLGFPEAPVVLPDGSFLFVEMTEETGCTTHISADGQTRRMVARTGRPNGLAMDTNGLIWVAETAMRAVLKMSQDGDFEVYADHCDGETFFWLNDLAFAPNGDLYVTDSGIEMETMAPGGEFDPNYMNLDYDGRVFKVDVKTGAVEWIDRGIMFTNGIAFGPDGDLYVAETLTGTIYKYRCENGIVVGDREFFGNVINPNDPEGLKGPDGMKFGKDGNLYVCVFGQGDVTVLGRDGEVVDRMKTGGIYPTNLVFGRDGERKIYVTEGETGTVRVCDVPTDGYPLHG